MADDPTCGAVLDRAEIGYIDHDGDHVCTLGPDHPHIRNHVCHCGYVWPKVDTTSTPRATEPTATQLYNAVKALRAANGHRVLTIPEINSVLVARDEWVAGVAAGPQATPDQVLEAVRELLAADDAVERIYFGTDAASGHQERLTAFYEKLQALRRVVAVPTDHEDPADAR